MAQIYQVQDLWESIIQRSLKTDAASPQGSQEIQQIIRLFLETGSEIFHKNLAFDGNFGIVADLEIPPKAEKLYQELLEVLGGK